MAGVSQVRLLNILFIWSFSFSAVAASVRFDVEEVRWVASASPSGRMWMETKIDSIDSRCLFDSGGQMTVVTKADFASYAAVKSAIAVGASGTSVPLDLIHVGQIQFGEFTNMNLTIGRKSGDVAQGASCVLGNETFADQAVRFDFENNQITTDLSTDSIFFPLTVIENTLNTIPVQVGGLIYPANWDTGSEPTVVDPEIIAMAPDNFSYVSDLAVVDFSGPRSLGKVYQMKSMTIGQEEIRDTTVLSYSLSPKHKYKMIIGFSTIRKFNWVMDHVNNRWSIDPKLTP
jgi:hypothetical protein